MGEDEKIMKSENLLRKERVKGTAKQERALF